MPTALRWLACSLLVAAALRADPAAALHQGFRNPPPEDSLSPYWYWNGPVSAAETRRQIRAMIAQEVREAVVFPWDGMQPAYLSEAYWKQFGAALEIARQEGFTLNFADEYLWPSGHAWEADNRQPELSRVLRRHPEFRMRRLRAREHRVAGGAEWRLTPGERPEVIAAVRIDAGGRADPASPRLVDSPWPAPAGNWLVTVYTLEDAVGPHNTRVDLLNPAAVRTYLELVYEEYARRFAPYFGKTVKLTLADHEGGYGVPIPYTPALWREFESRKGYDARPRLPLLTRASSEGAAAQTFRKDFLDVISALYAGTFTRQVTDWCARRGLAHGASLYEEQIWIQASVGGDMFAHWRNASAVFIDALLERGRQPLDFREASSVAHFDGKPLVVENQGLQGHGSFLSLEKARGVSNLILLWGANKLVPYFDYAPRNIHWPPQWFLGQPFWPWFHHYADSVRRGQFLNRQGTHVAPVLIYYPLETAFAHAETLFREGSRELEWNNFMDHVQNVYSALQLELARERIDCHVADRHYLAAARIVGRRLHLGPEQFEVVVLPPLTHLEPEAARRLEAFAAAGGRVIATGRLPDGLSQTGIQRFALPERPPFMQRLSYVEPSVTPAEVRADLRPVLAAIRAAIPPRLEVHPPEAPVLWSHRRGEGVEWYWVANESREAAARVRFRVPGSGALEHWDLLTGARERLAEPGGMAELDFEPGEARVLVRAGSSTARLRQQWQPERTLEIPHDGWRFLPDAPVRVPYAHTAEGDPVWLAPERLGQRAWWLIGPFPFDDHRGFFTAWPPEREFRSEARYPGAFGEVDWRWVESLTYTVTPRDLLGLERGKTGGIFYAAVWIHSPVDRHARLVAAAADNVQAWLNDEPALVTHRHPKWVLLRDVWAERRTARLRAGWNRLLLKVEQSLMVPAAFSARLTDAAGRTLRDLTWAARPDGCPPPRPRTPVRWTVAVPPGAAEMVVPPFLSPVRVNFAPQSSGNAPPAKPGTPLPVPAGAREAVFLFQRGDEPENPVEFRLRPQTTKLFRWTGTPLAHYSGSATYERSVDLPSAAPGRRLLLDLGEAGVAAEVWLNGKPAGKRAWRPFTFDITAAARAGVNRLRIRVANSDAGWQSQGDPIYPPRSWGLGFRSERDRLGALRPNGLEGPVRVRIERQKTGGE